MRKVIFFYYYEYCKILGRCVILCVKSCKYKREGKIIFMFDVLLIMIVLVGINMF